MRRVSLVLLLCLFSALAFGQSAAQDAVATPAGALPLPTAVGASANSFEISAFAPDVQALLVNARLDLELLANRQYGASRPFGWKGNSSIYDTQLPVYIRLDLELLVGSLISLDSRPTGWFGALAGTSFSVARDIRHDIELLADTVIRPGVRPAGWIGADPLLNCDRATQSLVFVLERSGIFTLNADPSQADFCQNAMLQASSFADINLLSSNATLSIDGSSTPAASGETSTVVVLPGAIPVDSDLAIAFLNRYGTEMVGRIPRGTFVQPLARSTAPFSRMILVHSDTFTVFMDYRDTTLNAEQFAGLPDINSVTENTSCDDKTWCKPVVFTLGNPASRRGG